MSNPNNDKLNDKLAVLIDADNTQASIIHELLAEVSRYGIATVKRAYGDWTSTNLKGWKEVLHRMAIQPMQQFSYTAGRNSTDSSLIIDAMDLLHSGHLDGFCLISSDSDFTRLATRIRETGRSSLQGARARCRGDGGRGIGDIRHIAVFTRRADQTGRRARDFGWPLSRAVN